ncbi:Sec1-like protein, partial [Blyttiomyces helicus]
LSPIDPQEHGVEKIYHLSSGKIDTECKSLIYICKPKIQYMKWIAEHIHAHTNANIKVEYSLFFVPRRTMICEKTLEDAGVIGEITLKEYHLDIVPLEDDLLSLELDNSFRELFLEGDTSSMYSIAKSVMKLQTIFGIIPRIVGKGHCARALADLLLRMRRELVANAEDDAASARIFPATSDIDSLIVIDRTVDMITPMCTQLTYEGLIDEVYGIKSSFVELDPAIIGPSSSTPAGTGTPTSSQAPIKRKKVPLNESDKLYSQLRNLNFAVVGGLLNQVARRIRGGYEERYQATTVSQIRDFVGKLGGLQAEHQSLHLHTGVTEEIRKFTMDSEFNYMLEVQQNFVAGILDKRHVDYIEELIDKQAPLHQMLRLLCLHSLVDGGLKPKYYDTFRREIVQTYGYKHTLTLQNLAKTGLLRRQDNPPRNPYPQIRNSLRLIVDDVNEHTPNDISYVYSGYAPISVRLVQAACQKSLGGPGSATSGAKASSAAQGATVPTVGWKGWEEPLRLLPGLTFEEVQRTSDPRIFANKTRNQPRTTLVLFLGGCTYTEVSALRFLSQQQEGQREYIVLTTQMINGTTLLDSMTEKVERASAGAA